MAFHLGNYTFIDERGVERSPEFHRIEGLERRVWTEEHAARLAELLTSVLTKPGATMKLRPIQAMALHDAGVMGGGFFPIRVAGGKTLISLLAAYVMGLKRPLLLIPASLKEKTKRQARALAAQWRIPVEILRIESYEQLSTPQSKNMLFTYRPDGIITDETHKLKNPKAAVTKRVSHYMKENPDTAFLAMSGTITKRSLKDYAHLVGWCLKDRAPSPKGYTEVEKWAGALDEKTTSIARVYPGALLDLATPEDLKKAEELEPLAGIATGDVVRVARLAYRRRLTESPGVVGTTEGYAGVSLIMEADVLPFKLWSPNIEGAYVKLRNDGFTLDDWQLTDSMSLWRHARELSLGFYYRWNPRPPEEWLFARKAWYKRMREILKTNRMHLDSEFLVTNAVRNGTYRPEGALDDYELWRKVEPMFTPTTEAVWIDDTVVDRVGDWLAKHPRGIAWVEHTAFGERLALKTGLPFFSRGGKDPQGRTFYDPTINPTGYKGACIASVSSNATGRDLQWAWSDNYVVSCPPNGLQWEQLLGRQDREGQESDEITVTVNVSCVEHYDALEQARADARYIEDSTGQAQKILYADLTVPDRWEIMGLPSRRFQR